MSAAGLLGGVASKDELETLANQKRWDEILKITGDSPSVAPDLLYYQGIALAGLGRLPEAATALKTGYQRDAGDRARFLVELAGVRFKQGRLPDAQADMRRAIRLGYADEYAYDFLGAVYFLDGNLAAALKYWNRIDKPRLREFAVEPPDILDSVLLDRLTPFSAGQILRLSEVDLADARLDGTGLFSSQRFALQAEDDGDFGLTLHLSERTGLNNSTGLQNLVFSLRDLPYSTLHGRLINLRKSGYNVSAAIRWQPASRRFVSTLSAPLRRDPSLVYSIAIEARDEQWGAQASASGHLPELRTLRATAQIRSVVNENWSWRTGLEAASSEPDAHRLSTGPAPLSGFSVASTWGVTRRMLYLPEHQFRIDADTAWELGRFTAQGGSLYSQLEADIRQDWIPRHDWRIRSAIRFANTWGVAPFSQLFRVGMDRDGLPLLRAHRFRLDRAAGLGPIGRGYALFNGDLRRTLYGNGLFSVSAGPFLDTGRVLDPLSPEHRAWLCDTGLEITVGILGSTDLKVSYGVDLRNGRALLFSRTTP